MTYYLPQQKVLRKILEKVFVNKKFTQSKTSRTLQIDVFEIPDKKNIGRLFSKCELLFLDHANSSSDPSQILILQFPTPRAFLLSSPSLSNFTLANWNSSSRQPLSSSTSGPLSHPTPFDHTLSWVLDKPNHLSSSVTQISYQVIYKLSSWYLMGPTCYPSKSWVFKDSHREKVQSNKIPAREYIINFAAKLAERSIHSFLLPIWWITFFKHLYS